MGLLRQFAQKMLSGRDTPEPIMTVPRLANYVPGATTLAYSARDKKMAPVDTRVFLHDAAIESLEAGRETLKNWKSYDLDKVNLSQGMVGIPGYWQIGYSAGFSCETLAEKMDEFLQCCDDMNAIFQRRYPSLPNNRIEDIGARYPDPIFHLGWLVGLGATHAQLGRYLDCTGAPGQDALFDRLVCQLGFERPVAPALRMPDDFASTLAVLDAPKPAQPAQVKKILANWIRTRYPDNPQIKPGEARYAGNWATDIALIVMLWDIDDASFRDHPHYPKDLVAFYRRNGPPARA